MAANMVAGSISIQLKADIRSMQKGLKQSEKDLGDFKRSITAVKTALAGFVGLEVAKQTFDLLGSSIGSSLARLDDLGDEAAKIGTSAEALSGLRFAAQLTGSEAADLDGILEKLNKNLGEAASSGGPAEEALQKMGLDARDLVRLDPAQAFLAIAAAFKTVKTPAEQASLAMDVFGRSGQSILNTLKAGPERISALLREAKDLGISFEELDLAKAGAAQDTLDRLGFALTALKDHAILEIAPVVVNLGESFLIAAKEAGGFGEIAKSGARLVIESIASVLDSIDPLIEKLSSVLDVFNAIPNAARSFSDGAKEAFHGLALGFGFNEKPTEKTPEKQSSGEKLRSFFKGFEDKLKPLDSASDLVAKADDSLSESFVETRRSVEALQTKMREQIETFGASQSEIEIFKLAQQGATEAELDSVRALDDQLEALKKKSEVEKQIADLSRKAKEARETFGMNEGAKAAYHLRELGAGKEEIQRAELFAKELDEIEKKTKRIEDLKKKSQDLKRDLRTPLEEAEEEIREARELFGEGLISAKDRDKAIGRAGARLFGQTPKLAGAYEYGSREARTTLLEARGFGPEARRERTMEEQLEEQRKQTAILRDVRDAAAATPIVFTI